HIANARGSARLRRRALLGVAQFRLLHGAAGGGRSLACRPARGFALRRVRIRLCRRGRVLCVLPPCREDRAMTESSPARLVPDYPFPPYAFVPGRFPHPISDPRGHSYGIKPLPCEPPDPDRWNECRPCLVGIDLFNHGYYWE